MMKQTSRLLAAAVLAESALVPLSALAQAPAEPGSTPADHASHPGHTAAQAAQAGQASTPAAPAAPLTDGEVRKIDKDAGKLTLKHGEIKHLDMPGMTMVFTVKDKALLDTVKVGDKVRFMVISEDGKLVVTQIQPAS
jgi:Cu/Ag efflux protein CusF